MSEEPQATENSHSVLKDIFLRVQEWPENPNLKKALSVAYWEHLEQTIRNKIQFGFNFTKVEQAFFDFGICCGEQFSQDENVVNCFESSLESEKPHIYEAVYGEMLNILHEQDLKNTSFITITSWLSKRFEEYRLIGQSTSIVIHDDLLRSLPNSYIKYHQLREERIDQIQSLEKLLQKCPGMNDTLLNTILSGKLHDESDSLTLQKQSTGLMQEKKKKLETLWHHVSQNLLSLFNNERIKSCLDNILQMTENIRAHCKNNQVDLQQFKEKAKDTYQTGQQQFKSLKKELGLLKNNLNVGAIKSRQPTFFPFVSQCSNPVPPEQLSQIYQLAYSCDRFFPKKSHFLLAPGQFEGFYEIDRESMILPAFHDNVHSQMVSALVDYRFIIESLQESSPFLKDLEELSGPHQGRKYFKALYEKWLQYHDQKEIQFNDQEIKFIAKHLSPSSESLYLNHFDFHLDKSKFKSLIVGIKQGKELSEHEYHILAGQFFSRKSYKDALQWIKKAFNLNQNPMYELAQRPILLALKEDQQADDLKQKLSEGQSNLLQDFLLKYG